MILSELLAHCSEYLDDKRAGDSALIDGDPDTLFSDEIIVRFLNQGQRVMARRAWVIQDEGNTVAGRIVLSTGVITYPLHKSVLRVYWALPSTTDAPLSRNDERQLMGPTVPGDMLLDFPITTADTGAPLGFSTDAGTRRIRFYRTPSADENGLVISLKVARLPLVELTADDPTGAPEIPEEYHLDLADYACGRCLLQPNVDTQLKVDGRELVANFDAAVKEARRDRERQEDSGSRWGFNSTTSVQ